MTFKLRRAIMEAAGNPDAGEALKILDNVPHWRDLASSVDADLSPKHRQRLIGICLRGGLMDDAAALCISNEIKPAAWAEAIILDPQYRGQGGHHHRFDEFYRDLISDELGMSVTLARPANSAALAEKPGGSIALPSIPADFRLFPRAVGAADLHALNALYERIFGRALPARRPRLIVVPTALHTFIEGLARYLVGTPGDAISLILGLHEPYWADPDPEHRRRQPFRAAFDTLAFLGNDLRVLIVAETQPIADGFRRSIGDDWDILIGSAFTVRSDISEEDGLKKAGKAVVGYAGRSSVDRGIGMIGDIVRATHESAIDLTWSIQIGPRRDHDPDVAAVGETLAPEIADGSVRFTPRRLSTEEFAELIRSIDILVMPFSADYNIRSSGLTHECLRFGTVMVAPEGSTIAQDAERQGAGLVTFAELTAEAVSAAISDAVDRLPELRSRAIEAAERNGKGHGLDRIVEFVEAA